MADIENRLRHRAKSENHGFPYQACGPGPDDIGYDAELDLRAADEIERLKAFEPVILSHSTPADLRISVAESIMENMVQAFDAFTDGAENYTSTHAKCGFKDYEIIVQRKSKRTAHELRRQAEEERDRLAQRVLELEELVEQLDTALAARQFSEHTDAVNAAEGDE